MTFNRRYFTLIVWLAVVIACVAVVARTQVRTDMEAFLPRSASMAQQVLTGQVRDGAASRLTLVGIEGVPPPVLARLSKAMATRLRSDPSIVAIANGDLASFADARDFFWRNRYLLSRTVSPQRFTVAGLHEALERDLGLLDSTMGFMVKQTLPGDPTGELYGLLQRLMARGGPYRSHGVWFSADARRALLLVHTRAPGFDIDAQQHVLAQIDRAFGDIQRATAGADQARLVTSGPGVFAVMTRDRIEHDATLLSALATAMVVGLLLFAYRSPRVVLVGALPVASGVLAGISAVSLGFGFVHGITLGFGVTLIGESVDYAVYVFTQTGRGSSAADTIDDIWPTLRLGALTSIVGFTVMLFSDFSGFAQLGLFSIAGLITAACFTRLVLPHLVPGNFFAAGAAILGRPLLVVIDYRRSLRVLVALLTLVGGVALAAHRGGFWDDDLTNLSPIPAEAQKLDRALRHDLGVPDLRYFVVFRTVDEQSALAQSFAVSATLRQLVAQHLLGGFDAPNQILPDKATQRTRQAALPDDATLRARFSAALSGLPFRADSFEPFFRDVAAARHAPLLMRTTLPAALQLELGSMLHQRPEGWDVVIPLRNVSDPAGVAAAVAQSGSAGAVFVDLTRESYNLLHTFEHEATLLAVIGSLAILALLFAALRSPSRVMAVTLPLAAAVIVTAALLTVGGEKLSVFMVVGFLLILAVGSNYSLFFAREYYDPEMLRRSVASVGLANLCTVSAYGLLSLSGIPVLHDIGITVAVGAFLSLIFSAVLSTRGAGWPPVGGQRGDRQAGRT